MSRCERCGLPPEPPSPRDLPLCECALVDTNIARYKAEARCRELESRLEASEAFAAYNLDVFESTFSELEDTRATLDAVHAVGWTAICRFNTETAIYDIERQCLRGLLAEERARATKAEQERDEAVASCDKGTCQASRVLHAATEEAVASGLVRGAESLREYLGGVVPTLQRQLLEARATLATRDAEVLRLLSAVGEALNTARHGDRCAWLEDRGDCNCWRAKAKAALEQGEKT